MENQIEKEIDFEVKAKLIAEQILELAKCLPKSDIRQYRFFVKFTRFELIRIPKTFRKVLADDSTVVCVRRFSENSVPVYQINYNRYGYNVNVTGNTVSELKKNFIRELNKK